MASGLSPPPLKSRSRASSTSLRPAITIHTLGRRRSTSCLQQERPSPPSHESSMLVLFLSKLIHLHGLSWSTPPSPTTDDFILPLSDSSHSIKPSHRLSVCYFVLLLFLFIYFLIDTRPHPPRHPSFAPLHRTSSVVSLNPSHFCFMAAGHCRSRPTRSRTPRLLPEWSRTPLSRHCRHGCICCLETRLVRSRQRPLGLAFLISFFGPKEAYGLISFRMSLAALYSPQCTRPSSLSPLLPWVPPVRPSFQPLSALSSQNYFLER